MSHRSGTGLTTILGLEMKVKYLSIKSLLVLALLCVSTIGMSANAEARYGYNKYSSYYKSNNYNTGNYSSRNYGYSNRSYQRSSYSSGYRSSYRSTSRYSSRYSSRYRGGYGRHGYSSWYSGHHGSYYGRCRYDRRPIARADVYTGEVGSSFSQNVITENDYQGDAPATASIVSGQLPNGLTLSSNGSLTGIPTESGVFTVVYKIRDRDGDTSKCTITITIEDPNLLPIAVDDNYQGEVGVPFLQNVIDENDTQGDGIATAVLDSGELPPGVTLESDGTLSGTPTATGTFTSQYTITDENGDQSCATITIVITEMISYCPQAADSDDLGGGGADHAIWIPGISRDLRFVGAPMANRTLPTGDMQVTGTVSDGNLSFDVIINYSDFQDSSSDPKLELPASAYVANGGVIDPSTWDFYQSMDATLVGTEGSFTGVTLSAELRGPLAQIGVGANGKNANFGLSNWFEVTIESATNGVPSGYSLGQSFNGDVNIDLPDECPREIVATMCAVKADGDAYAQFSSNHAIVIFGLPGGAEFIFDPAGQVDIYDNGDLTVTGSATNSSNTLDVSLEYTDFTEVNPDPKLELIASAYVDQGGPVDPSTWTYHQSLSGTLTGNSGDMNGVVISASLRGSLPQLGNGANGKNVEYGMSNWFDFEVLSAPAGAPVSVGDTFRGDLNADFKDNCDENLLPLAVDDRYGLFAGQTGFTANILDNDDQGDAPATIVSLNQRFLPPNMSVDENGVLSGIPRVGGVFTIPYTIEDANGDQSTATITIVVESNN